MGSMAAMAAFWQLLAIGITFAICLIIAVRQIH